MKTYSYSRASHQGRRLYQLLYAQHNQSVLENGEAGALFKEKEVPAVMQCRANKIEFIIQGGLSGIKRPHVRLDGEVDQAWGDFTEDVTTLDFTHSDETLPFSYVQPIENDTMKILIDAGFYDDPYFEELMLKIVSDDVFEAEGELRMAYLNIGDEQTLTDLGRDSIPFVLVEPVSIVHDDKDKSADTTIQGLLTRSAHIAIELRKGGYKSSEFVETPDHDRDLDREVYLTDIFKDVVEQQKQEEVVEDTISTSSDLLDQEIDVTDELKGNISRYNSSESERIRDLKQQVALDEESQFDTEVDAPDEDHVEDSVDTLPDFDDIDDYEIEDEDEGPSF